MTPGHTLHTSNKQPLDTLNKVVIIRLFESDRYTVNKADQINWKIDGLGAPTESGRVIEYSVV